MKPREIKNLRKALKLTQIQFSIVMHASFATVNRWEAGHNVPGFESIMRMKKMKKRLKEYGRL